MTEHPSLSAPPVMIRKINAVATMKPYEQCWCRSGKKYKFCHFRREKEKPFNFLAEDQKIREQFQRGYCSHPEKESCSAKIVSAHTVQRNGGLSAISERGHVLTVKPNMKLMIEHEGNPPPQPLGIGKASVFPGFCASHDNSLFKKIEGKTISMDIDSAFMFSYRAVSYEAFRKGAELQACYVQSRSDQGSPLWMQEIIQRVNYEYTYAVKLGIQDVSLWKTAFDKSLLARKYDGFFYYSVKSNGLLSVVCCAMFHLEIDLDGNVLQVLGRISQYEGLAMTVTAFAGATLASFGWIGSEDGPARKFIASFHQTLDCNKADAIVRIVFAQSDNLFCRISWWDQLSDAEKKHLADLAWSGTGKRDRLKNDLVFSNTSYATNGVAEIATNVAAL